MRVCITIISMLLVVNVHAQKVKGKLVDKSTNEPLSYATLTLFDEVDKIIGGNLSDELGAFEIVINDKVARIELNHLGYQPKIFTKPFNTEDFEVITLAIDAQELDEVVVEAAKTTREFKIDRKVINVGSDLQASGGTALEVFQQLPEVEVDPISSDVRIRGASGVRVLVNGKPSPLNTSDLLEQIDASQIEKIEIISSPSAKYQADGLSGLVNIVLKDQVIEGLRATTNIYARTNPGYGASANVVSGFGKVNLQGGISYRDNYFLNESTSQREFQQSGLGQNVSLRREFEGSVTNYNIKADVFLNTNNDLSVSFNYTNNVHDINPITRITEAGTGQSRTNNLFNTHEHSSDVYNLNYQKRFTGELKRHLDIDVNLNDNKNNLPSVASEDGVETLNNQLKFNNAILNTAIDLYWQFNESSFFETGALFTHKRIDNQLSSTQNGVEDFFFYKYAENTIAGYFLWNKQMDKIGIKAGVRGEYFQSDGDINNEEEAIQREFTNLFPSLHISYKQSDQLNFSFGYNRRINRPSFYDLNPYTTINDPLFIREGNPELRPVFTDNMELNMQYSKGSISINNAVFGRYTSDLINRTFDINDAGVTIMKFENGGESYTLGIENTVSKDLSEAVSFSLTSAAHYREADPMIDDFYHKHQYGYSFRSKLKAELTKSITADLQWNYYGVSKRLNNKSEAYNFVNLALQCKVLNKKGTVTLRVSDLFDTNVYRNKRISNAIIENMRWKGQTQTATLSFSYRFMKGKIVNRNATGKRYSESGALE
ncbi:outer membrane beta-barrel family protein [Fulvivirga lutimaris]|uniref:outer membrane beta-barrel family protein n=1 Tax=Fulvivirga lutimaris TaxID=1819566 RepID=UPI0012BC12A0|nr:outer membrane beta-barrel family protein [Fulvivirga lutimaris]MTI39377.1 TonB-dependent receptor [Fulvivirga lutimaris]